MPTSIPETESAVQASTSSGAAYTSTSNDEKSGKKKEKDATLFRIWLDFALSPKIFRVPGGTGSGSGCPWFRYMLASGSHLLVEVGRRACGVRMLGGESIVKLLAHMHACAVCAARWHSPRLRSRREPSLTTHAVARTHTPKKQEMHGPETLCPPTSTSLPTDAFADAPTASAVDLTFTRKPRSEASSSPSS